MPAVIEGSCVVKPPKDVFEEGISEWKFAHVGQFIGSAPAFGSIQRVVSMLWGKASPIKHKPIFLRRWEPNLKELQFDLIRMPIWIHLYNVPLELFSRRGLSYIASAGGRPLHMDSVTAAREKLEYAQVCIEITDGSSIQDRIDVVLNDESVASIRVSVPWMPSSCTDCGRFGHSVKLCPRGKKLNRYGGPRGLSRIQIRLSLLLVVGTNRSLVECHATAKPVLDDGCELVNQIDIIADVSKIYEGGTGFTVTTKQVDHINNPLVKRGRGRLAKEGKITGGASKNKFDVLNSLDPDSVLEIPIVDSSKKQRGASMGVAKLVQELKIKKKEHVDKVKKLEERGGASSSTSFCCNYDYAENGRIWVLWKSDVVCSIISSFNQSIILNYRFKNIEFFITVVYGSNDGSICKHFWTQLCSVEASVGDRAWLIGGDFNFILNAEESSSQINAGRKLDRVLVNLNWLEVFPASDVEFQAPGDSDHCLALVWLNIIAELEIEKELRALEQDELLFYKQKEKKSTGLGRVIKVHKFHSMIATKRKCSTVRVLYNQSGTMLDIVEDMSNEVVSFFVNQLGVADPEVKASSVSCIKDLLGFSLSCEAVDSLCRAISETEIKEALWGQGNNKSPGLDRYNAFFFKRTWSIVGEDFLKAVRYCFDHSFVLPSFNATAVLKRVSLAIIQSTKRIGLTHLCFADDLLIFCKGTTDSVMGVQVVLDHFYSMSGLKLNASKCDMYAAGIPDEQLNIIKESTGFKLGSLSVRYLGVPLVTKKLAVKDCQGLIDKIIAKLSSWACKHLSFVGRLQLVCSVLLNITSYWSRQLILPQAFIRKVERLCSCFFWKGSDTPTKGARVSWKVICLLKSEGGLGINDVGGWNKSCSVQLIRKLLANDGSLWVVPEVAPIFVGLVQEVSRSYIWDKLRPPALKKRINACCVEKRRRQGIIYSLNANLQGIFEDPFLIFVASLEKVVAGRVNWLGLPYYSRVFLLLG
ncbi:uncharacterized protein LOC120138595 [Hibiscus syriacus]|uniref:uncharacterized protein LOC120138595 n=1 Tax=Hibiscus syriacus TaxID=106335 RepID=UPI001921B520|nr:uncharacterized protein LOC120138595 [Hibiscus syriacus]